MPGAIIGSAFITINNMAISCYRGKEKRENIAHKEGNK